MSKGESWDGGESWVGGWTFYPRVEGQVQDGKFELKVYCGICKQSLSCFTTLYPDNKWPEAQKLRNRYGGAVARIKISGLDCESHENDKPGQQYNEAKAYAINNAFDVPWKQMNRENRLSQLAHYKKPVA